MMSGNVHPSLAPSFLVQCAMEMWTGGVGQSNAAPAPNEFIWSAHYSPFLDLELLAPLTPGAALSAAFLLLLEIPHLHAL